MRILAETHPEYQPHRDDNADTWLGYRYGVADVIALVQEGHTLADLLRFEQYVKDLRRDVPRDRRDRR
ncbi:MAG: hypothetical protein GY906_34475 [bacterium]|nr:hypothetical protein [bacterium]